MSKISFLKYPVNPLHINQNFGADMSCVDSKNNVVTKATSATCPAGYVSLYAKSGMKGHNGLDLRAYHGQEVYAACEGYVEEVQTEEARGLGLGIVTNELYFCTELNRLTQWKIRYWHLKGFEVKKGDYVEQGQLIGYADNTGFSSGDHLHCELKPVSVKKGVVTNLLQNNGYYGGVDPIPYLESPKFAFTKNIYMYETSDDVEELQKILIKEGLLDIPKPTRFFGNLTRVAVMRLQNLSGIPTNYGVVAGIKTRGRLNELLNK